MVNLLRRKGRHPVRRPQQPLRLCRQGLSPRAEGENGEVRSVGTRIGLEPFADKPASERRAIANSPEICEGNVRSPQSAGRHEAAIDRDSGSGNIVRLL